MKKILAILVGAALVAAVAVPLLAYGPGWGRGHHRMGPWGSGPGYSQQYERGLGNLTEEQRSQLEQLDRKYYPNFRSFIGFREIFYGFLD